MISMKKYTNAGNAGGNFLHGSDVDDKDSVTIKVLKVREATGLNNAAFVFDIEPTGRNGAKVWAVNRTNANLIAAIFFPDDDDPNAELMAGKELKLDVVQVNDPTKDELVPSLQVAPVQPSVRAAKKAKHR